MLAGSGGWRIMFGLAVIPAAVLGVGMLRLPESPRWLVDNGRHDLAETVLRRLRPSGTDSATDITNIREVSSGAPRTDRRALTRPRSFWRPPRPRVHSGRAGTAGYRGGPRARHRALGASPAGRPGCSSYATVLGPPWH
ncbi:MFS transporter [Streptomyces sp. NPDC090057]|uniref:MFS transporter n=1 Tax=Streptomyces sp. NPDC090057 TaxID=3365935 RepID=UPI003819ED6A